jgi:hypothetical protein
MESYPDLSKKNGRGSILIGYGTVQKACDSGEE